MRGLLAATVFVTCLAVIGCATYKPANPYAFGRQWELMGVEGNSYAQIFYDPQKTTVHGPMVRSETRAVLTDGREAVGKIEVACSRKAFFLSDVVLYDSSYRPVSSEQNGKWFDIPPNSVMAVFVQRYCR